MSKTNLVISTFLTVSILTTIAGILAYTGNQQTAQSALASQSASVQSTREATYQSLLAQANTTIAQANQQIVDLENQINSASVASTETTYPVSAQQAEGIASQLVGLTTTGNTRLVNYNGLAAYEVVFSQGNVYVDAESGNVIYNGIQVLQSISAEQAISIAENYLGNTSVAGIASGMYGSVSAYQIVFQNGSVVYVDIYGKVLAVSTPSGEQSNSASESSEESD